MPKSRSPLVAAIDAATHRDITLTLPTGLRARLKRAGATRRGGASLIVAELLSLHLRSYEMDHSDQSDRSK